MPPKRPKSATSSAGSKGKGKGECPNTGIVLMCVNACVFVYGRSNGETQ